MPSLEHDVDALAERTGFSGVVRVESGSGVELSKAYGLADRGHGIPNTTETQFGLASGTKGLTALTVVSLIDDGLLDLSTTARSALGRDLPLIADDVTVEHLLAHRSGIGDYYDEDAGGEITDYILPIPVHRLETTAGYLPALEGYPTVFPAGERFAYCNGGFVVLALIAERAAGRPFHDLVRERVCEPAGMNDTAFLRSDELPGRAALGISDERRPADERAPPARPRKRRRRDLLDGGRHQLALARVPRRADRLAHVGGGDDTAPERRPRAGAALRPRRLAPPVERRRPPRRLRRGRVVHEHA